MPSSIARREVSSCREALAKTTILELVNMLKILPVERITQKRKHIEIIYVYRPDEFTRRRIKVKAETEKAPELINIRTKGALEITLTVECASENELIVTLIVGGKAEHYIDEKKVKEIADKIADLIASRSPPAPKPTPPPPVAAAAAAAATAAKAAKAMTAPMTGTSMSDCVERLITAGLRLDEILSKQIPSIYHPHASASGVLVAEGRGNSRALDLREYKDGYDIRLTSGNIFIEIVRLGGRVGVYYNDYNTGEELTGSAAIRRIEETICKEERPLTYLVLKMQAP